MHFLLIYINENYLINKGVELLKLIKMFEITSRTRFRRFNFTLYENLDTFVCRVYKIFEQDNNPFKYLVFRVDANSNSSDPDFRRIVQGYAEIDQMRLGCYSDRVTSGIKGIMQTNSLHIEFAYGTREECIDYVKRDSGICEFVRTNNFTILS